MRHSFALQDIPPGKTFVIETCRCGARRKRNINTIVLYEQNDGSWTKHKTECLGAYANNDHQNQKTEEIQGEMSTRLEEAVVTIKTLMIDYEKGKGMASNFLAAYHY